MGRKYFILFPFVAMSPQLVTRGKHRAGYLESAVEALYSVLIEAGVVSGLFLFLGPERQNEIGTPA